MTICPLPECECQPSECESRYAEQVNAARRAGFDEGWDKAKAEDSDTTRLQRLERQMADVIAHQERTDDHA